MLGVELDAAGLVAADFAVDHVISALAVTMFAYSAMKNIENFIELYSVW